MLGRSGQFTCAGLSGYHLMFPSPPQLVLPQRSWPSFLLHAPGLPRPASPPPGHLVLPLPRPPPPSLMATPPPSSAFPVPCPYLGPSSSTSSPQLHGLVRCQDWSGRGGQVCGESRSALLAAKNRPEVRPGRAQGSAFVHTPRLGAGGRTGSLGGKSWLLPWAPGTVLVGARDTGWADRQCHPHKG